MSYSADQYTPHHGGRVIKWDHKINLVGSKVPNPRVHLCEKCNFPIFLYGRMIPCKHIFCYDCAKTTEKTCLRCGDRVTRIEQTHLGSIYLCDDGAPKHSHKGCCRTYLSQRDLQAHINHRHKKQTSKDSGKSSSKERRSDPRKDPRKEDRDPRRDPRTKAYPQSSQSYPPSTLAPPPPPVAPQTAPHYDVNVPGSQEQNAYHMEHTLVRKSNLITVPLQDSGSEYREEQPQIYAAPAGQVASYSGSQMLTSSEHPPTFNAPQSAIPFPQHVAPGGVMVQPQSGYGSPGVAVSQTAPPPPVPYIVPPVDPQNPSVVHYEGGQPPIFPPNVPIRAPYSTTNVPVTGSPWSSPVVSQESMVGSAPARPHGGIPDSSSYHGQYYQ